MSLTEVLLGARLRRIDIPSPHLMALSLALPTRKAVLLIGLSSRCRGIGLSEERPLGAPASGFVRQLRKALQGARIEAVQQPSPGRLEIVAGRRESSVRLRCDLFGVRGNAYLLDAEGLVVGALHPGSIDRGHGPPERASGPPRLALPDTEEALWQAGHTLRASHRRANLD